MPCTALCYMAFYFFQDIYSNGKYFFVMGYAPNSGKSILGNTIQKLYPENSVSNFHCKTEYRPPDPQHQGRIPDCPYCAGSLHRHIHHPPGMDEALPDSEIWGYGGVRFSVPDVQKCRGRFCPVRKPLP